MIAAGAAAIMLAGCHSSSPPVDAVGIRAVRIATFDQPDALVARRGDQALYVAERTGRVWAIRGGFVDPRPVLDLSGHLSLGAEEGLLGIAFSPDGSHLYVDETGTRGNTNLLEYAFLDGVADVSTRRRVLFVRQPFDDHKGGQLAFGADGMLYVALGDGGSAGDPRGYAQSVSSLLGKILRIDPRPSAGHPYSIPGDNPFVHVPGARPELWDIGLRNPWRFSFDTRTGDLWIADVGQDRWEEIDVHPAGARGGLNFGWNRLEGTHPFTGAAPRDAVPPVYEYSHDQGGCAVTGGYVYRGSALPALRGAYVFGDFCLGRIVALRMGAAGSPHVRPVGVTIPDLASFGQDGRRELYAVSLGGGVYRLEAG